MGRMPIIAAPQATPKKPSSAIGVLIMRSGNFFSSPSVTVKAPPHPPGTAMSSPMQNTRSSRSISSAMASRKASAIPSRLVIIVLWSSGKYVGGQVLQGWQRLPLRDFHRLVELLR